MTQKGFGNDDGIYRHSSESQGVRPFLVLLSYCLLKKENNKKFNMKQVILEIESAWDRNQWRFARLFSRDYDDLLGWYDLGEGEHRFGVW